MVKFSFPWAFAIERIGHFPMLGSADGRSFNEVAVGMETFRRPFIELLVKV